MDRSVDRSGHDRVANAHEKAKRRSTLLRHLLSSAKPARSKMCGECTKQSACWDDSPTRNCTIKSGDESTLVTIPWVMWLVNWSVTVLSPPASDESMGGWRNWAPR